jgi:hypothetical protein
MNFSRLVGADLRRIRSRTPKFDDLRFEPIRTDLERIPCEPGLYVPDHLARIRSCGFGARLRDEIAKIEATSWLESSTEVCELKDALVLGGEIFTPEQRFFMHRSSPYRASLQGTVGMTSACLPNSFQGLQYFGHWLRDDCSAFEVARGIAPVVSLSRPDWTDCPAYERAFGQDWTDLTAFQADRLTLVRDVGFNLDKGKRFELLRKRARESVKAQARLVYLARGRTGVRRSIVNEEELLQALSANGFAIVRPETARRSVLEQCMDADLIATIEGSQAAHAVFCLRPKGSLLVIQPPDRFYNPHVEWVRLLGMRYGIVVGQSEGEAMRVTAREVLEMTEKLLAA